MGKIIGLTFPTDTDKIEAIMENPYILITDKKISNIQEILPLLEEYWYDDPDSIIQWKDALYGVLND